MNNRELITELSKMTKVSIQDCENVMKAFEELLTEGFSEKKWKSCAFDFVVRMVNAIKNDKESFDPSSTK